MLVADVIVYWALGYIGFSAVNLPAVLLALGVLMLIADSWMSVKRILFKTNSLYKRNTTSLTNYDSAPNGFRER
ncbi:MAG: hypothetical protein LBG19_02615 [Prevotellaceae bacterium]|nr:hypothetical protein [Prevotellaceae bacterium]